MNSIVLNAYPLCFHSTIIESELEKRECGDGIYVSSHYFRHFNNTDSDEIVILKLSNNGQSVYTTISGVHSEDSHSILLPSWMFQFLSIDCGLPIQIERFTETRIGLTIRIQPHTSGYASLDDPVGALRDAFENYTVLVSGMVIPLYVNNSILIVNIIDTYNSEPICIRGSELTVEIDRPLDLPEEPNVSEKETVAIDFDEELIPMTTVENRFPGKGHTLGFK